MPDPYALNFTKLTFGPQTSNDAAGLGTFAETFRVPGIVAAELQKRPRKIVTRRDANGLVTDQEPTQHVFSFTVRGEWNPVEPWHQILQGLLQGHTATIDTPTGKETHTLSPNDDVPVLWTIDAGTEGDREVYRLQGAALAALAITWPASAAPVFRAEWEVLQVSSPASPTVAATAPEHDIDATSSPRKTNVYLRLNETAWTVPLSDSLVAAQNLSIRIDRPLEHARFTRDGVPQGFSWSSGVSVSGRLGVILVDDGDAESLITGEAPGIIRIIQPNPEDPLGFDLDILGAQLAVNDAPLLADSWASRQVEFVAQRSASGGLMKIDLIVPSTFRITEQGDARVTESGDLRVVNKA